jgi:hypothetical protein
MSAPKTLLAVLAITAIAGSAAAAAPPLPVRGTITAITGNSLTITETSGATASIALAPDAKVIEVLPASLADVKSGTYVGTAAIKQHDGTYRAMELQIFPESMRGVGLGTRPWNLKPHSSMTNGTVGGMAHDSGTVGAVSGNGDLTLTVNDGKGTKQVLVPQDVPVVTYAPGSKAELQPGAHVIFFPTQGTTISRISVGKNGLVPPM